jgi:hypothetical protein
VCLTDCVEQDLRYIFPPTIGPDQRCTITQAFTAVEESLRGAVIPGLPDMLCKVDLIVETQDALAIRDWKTSRS